MHYATLHTAGMSLCLYDTAYMWIQGKAYQTFFYYQAIPFMRLLKHLFFQLFSNTFPVSLPPAWQLHPSPKICSAPSSSFLSNSPQSGLYLCLQTNLIGPLWCAYCQYCPSSLLLNSISSLPATCLPPIVNLSFHFFTCTLLMKLPSQFPPASRLFNLYHFLGSAYLPQLM